MNATVQQNLSQSQKINPTIQKFKQVRETELPSTFSDQDHRILPIIEAIATGVPPHVLKQSDAAKSVANLPSIKHNQSRIDQIYQNTRIDTRHMEVDTFSASQADFCRDHNTIKARMELFREHGIPLAERVAKKAISNLADLQDLGLIVFVSSTGFIAPGVDAELIKRLGLNRNIARVNVNFMGCAAAMNGLRVSADYVRAYPQKKALMVCLELSSINAVFADNLNDIIIHSIFADGCGAVVLGGYPQNIADGSGKIAITEHLSHLIENTEDGIVLGIEGNGITCKLSRHLPDYIEAGIGKIIEDFLASNQLSKADIELWAVHPGGTKMIQKARDALGLTDAQVAISWNMLHRYGNMLSVSILFVLQQMFQQLDQSGKSQPVTGIAFSFAPGVGLEGILFQQM